MRKRGKNTRFVLLLILSLLVWLPLLFLASGSLMNSLELKEKIGMLFDGKNQSFATFTLFPDYPTLKNYVGILFDTPSFYQMFFHSSVISVFSVLGQLLIGTPAAWWFSRNRGKGSQAGFVLYILLMSMPFQVTLLSNYLVLDTLHLLDTLWCIILPLVFSTFPIFIMKYGFDAIPEALFEAAEIDGTSELQIFLRIGVPLGKAGIVSAALLGFIECWNLVEQPMTFLKNEALWPLSLFQPGKPQMSELGLLFVTAVMTLIPSVLVFLYGQSYLEESVASLGGKE